MGGLPRRCRLGGCQRYPAGGVPALSPAYPATVVPAGGVPALSPVNPALTCFPAPIPPPPSRREGGDYRLFFARGCAPCIPGAEPARHWFAPPLWKTQWGLASALSVRRVSAVPGGGRACFAACLPCHCGARGGRVGFGRLLTLPLACFLAPYPPHPPSPVGKGEIFCFLMQGASPLASPGLNPRGTGYACGKLVLWALSWHRHPPGQREPVL